LACFFLLKDFCDGANFSAFASRVTYAPGLDVLGVFFKNTYFNLSFREATEEIEKYLYSLTGCCWANEHRLQATKWASSHLQSVAWLKHLMGSTTIFIEPGCFFVDHFY